MEEQLISKEVAILAKEKGFNEPTLNHWERGIDGYGWGLFSSGDLLKNQELTKTYQSNEGICGEFSAPTQSLLQKWLREVHNIHICNFKVNSINEYCFEIEDSLSLQYFYFEDGGLRLHESLNSKGEYDKPIYYNTYEQSLEYTLQEALKLINL